MKKKTFTFISVSYTILVLVSFCIYAYFVQEGGSIDTEEHFYELLLFGVLGFVGLFLASVDAAGVREKGRKLNNKALCTGAVIAVLFLLWRIV
ncbi:hypothetical protein [Bacillus sp. UMB0728]|uniref:hypothetical protein n=1 Tax=Bacillus sp. UMB0728 TaxID=2066052 RepID=UPI001157AD02|nr:hypothetical protein [Bacillus sp. UMB0728]